MDEAVGPGTVTWTSEATPGATGALEVQVVGGPMLHSRKGGDGYVDTPQKMEAIIQGVKKLL